MPAVQSCVWQKKCGQKRLNKQDEVSEIVGANAYKKEPAYDGNAALKMTTVEMPMQQSRTKQPQAKPVRPKVEPNRQKNKAKQQSKASRMAAPVVQIDSQAKPTKLRAPAAMVAIFAVALVVILTLVSYAQLVMINDQVVDLRGQLSELKTEETRLMAQYELAYDLQEIETKMLTSGQMTKVQDWQTYTLELSEPDGVEYYKESNLGETIILLAKDFVSMVKEYF